MDVWLNNHFPWKDFESSNWNYHKELVVWSSRILYFWVLAYFLGSYASFREGTLNNNNKKPKHSLSFNPKVARCFFIYFFFTANFHLQKNTMCLLSKKTRGKHVDGKEAWNNLTTSDLRCLCADLYSIRCWECTCHLDVFYFCWLATVDVWNPARKPPGMSVWNPINNGKNYQPQLVQDFSHQQYSEFFLVFFKKTHSPLWTLHLSLDKNATNWSAIHLHFHLGKMNMNCMHFLTIQYNILVQQNDFSI